MTYGYTLITGASSGMGESTAYKLCKERNLILNGRNTDRLHLVAEKCRLYGHDVIEFSFDLSNANEVSKSLSDLLLDNKVYVDTFIHCAGMTEVLPISRTKYSVGLEVMNVNYFSATEIISTLLKKKINQASLTNIVLISSIIAEGGKKYQPHYCASKGALESLTKALACELAPKVRVNAIAPGSFKTRIINTVFKNNDENAPWAPPTLLEPKTVESIAKTVNFLVSDASDYITGQIINVDGGERFPKF